MKLIKEIESIRDSKGHLRRMGVFKCLFCLQEIEIRLSNGLKQKSCGCIHQKGENNSNYEHGGCGTRLYNIWKDIKRRCSNPKRKYYKHYGGRGITICPEWTDKLNGFTNFRDWALNNDYQEGLEIDREDTNGNYEPSNCRWVTTEENLRNTTRNVIKSIEQANEIRELYKINKYTRKELANKYNVNYQIIVKILNNEIWRSI